MSTDSYTSVAVLAQSSPKLRKALQSSPKLRTVPEDPQSCRGFAGKVALSLGKFPGGHKDGDDKGCPQCIKLSAPSASTSSDLVLPRSNFAALRHSAAHARRGRALVIVEEKGNSCSAHERVSLFAPMNSKCGIDLIL